VISAGGWRDLGLMRRLTPLGVCLHSEAVLTTGARVLQKGLVGLFVARRGVRTLVWRGDGDVTSAFAQMQLEDTVHRAPVYLLAPTGEENPLRPTVALLEGFVREAGARGARNLTAEAQDGTAEFDALRRAGFVIYARQQVFRLLTRPPAVKTDIAMQPCGSQDEIATQRLYSNIVPALVRQVEPAPTGTWVQPYVHPEAEGSIDEVLAAFLL